MDRTLLWESHFRQRRLSPNAAETSGLIGVTLWRLRPSQTADRARIIFHEKASSPPVELTPERINLQTRLGPDEKLKFSVESGLEGFLYIASREEYADGTKGPAYLTFRRQRRDQVSEEVIAAVLPTPLPGLMVRDDAQLVRVPPQQIDQWVKGSGKSVDKLDLESASSGAWTAAERSSALRESLLGPGDPVPQRLYRLASNNSGHTAIFPLLLAQ
jgi:hypothetical protein